MAVTVLALIFTLAIPSSASAAPSPRGAARAMGYYVALGDSLAAGYQPGSGDDKTGGYVGGVYAALRTVAPKTKLVNLACSGETTTTMVEGGLCAYRRGSQLAEAVHFVRAHRQHTRLVTIDIGANDVQRCVKNGVVDQACIQRGMSAVATNLPSILRQLRTAAPRTKIVVLNYYNPFLAAWLTGPAGQDLARTSTGLQQMLNGIIASAAAANGAALADVAGAFRSTDWSVVQAPGLGSVPVNVLLICRWTWMCTKSDIHANDQGYVVLAATVVLRLLEGRRAA